MIRRLRHMLGLLIVIFVDSREVQAQWLFAPFESVYTSSSRFGIGLGTGCGFSAGFAFHHSLISAGVGGWSLFSPTPFWYGPPPYLGWTGVGNPWFFPPPTFFAPPPIVVIQAVPWPIARIPGFRGGLSSANGTLLAEAAAVPEPAALPDRPAIPIKREAFIVIQPGGDPRRLGLAEFAKPAEELPGGFGRRLEPQGWPDRSPPIRDPEKLAAMQIQAARSAFVARQYGRAAELLAAAIHRRPAEPVPYFLLAQVQTAQGRYAEAVASLRQGLTLAPHWPRLPFNLRELYGTDAAQLLTHLQELRQTAAAHPEDPTLAFLLGYYLWHLGDKAEALRLLRQASRRARDNQFIERFIDEAVGQDI